MRVALPTLGALVLLALVALGLVALGLQAKPQTGEPAAAPPLAVQQPGFPPPPWQGTDSPVPTSRDPALARESARVERLHSLNARLEPIAEDYNCSPVMAELIQVHEHSPPRSPSWALATSALGACLWALQDYDAAQALFEAAIAADPDNPRWLEDLASLYRHQQRFTEAIHLLERALSMRESADTHQFLAIVQRHHAAFEELSGRDFLDYLNDSEANLVRMAEIDPLRAPEIYQDVAHSLFERSEYEQASHYMELAVAALLSQPDHPFHTPANLALMYVFLGEVFLRAGQLAVGNAYLDYAVHQAVGPEMRDDIASRGVRARAVLEE
jgi:tetratricopeptide (TPR) repeat protein